MGRRAQEIELTEAQKQILEHLSASRSQPYSRVQRAKVILEAATGEQNKRIGAHLGMHARHVQKWRVRWAEQAERLGVIVTVAELEAAIQGVLSDRPRPGCPPAFSAEQMCRIVELACRSPEDLEYPVNYWTPKELARAAVQQGIVAIASPFLAKPFGTSQSPKGAKHGRRVIAFGAPAVPIANVALIATFPARLVRTQPGVRTSLADDSTPGRNALWVAEGRATARPRDLRPPTRRSGFRGLLDSLAHSLHVSQRRQESRMPFSQFAAPHSYPMTAAHAFRLINLLPT